jgi:uncharacterized membrane protein
MFHRVSARQRLGIVVLVGACFGLAAGWFAPWQSSVLGAWDVAAAAFLVWVWGSIRTFDAAETKEFATREDDSRISAQLLLLLAAVGSIAGIIIELAKASSTPYTEKAILTGAAAITIVLSWAVVHTVFCLRYAHEYYTAPVGGIDFKNDIAPDYQDFAYVAFTIGMTFQISDTDIRSPVIRRTVLRHSLLAYLFGAVILATSVNLVATLLQ